MSIEQVFGGALSPEVIKRLKLRQAGKSQRNALVKRRS